MSPMKICL